MNKLLILAVIAIAPLKPFQYQIHTDSSNLSKKNGHLTPDSKISAPILISIWLDISLASENGIGAGMGLIWNYFGFQLATTNRPELVTELNYYVPHGDYYVEPDRVTVTPKMGVDIYLTAPLSNKSFAYVGVGRYTQSDSEVHVSTVTGWRYTPEGTMRDYHYYPFSLGFQFVIENKNKYKLGDYTVGFFFHKLRGIGFSFGIGEMKW